MAKEFHECKEVDEIIAKLKEKFPNRFPHINSNEVKGLMQMGNSKVKVAFVRAVRPPYSLFTKVKYLVAVIEERFVDRTSAQKHLILYHELMHIPQEMDGKTIKHDCQDFADIVAKFGPNWVNDDKLKDILV